MNLEKAEANLLDLKKRLSSESDRKKLDEVLLFVRDREWVEWSRTKKWAPKTLVGVDVREGSVRYIDRLENIRMRNGDYFKRIKVTKIVDPDNRCYNGGARR